MSSIKRPSYLRIDALKELGNIGSAHAVTGLSKLLKKRIDVSITDVEIIPIQIIYNLFNGPESMVSVVYLEGYNDNFRSMMFLVFPYHEADKMVNIITRNSGREEESEEYCMSVLKEVGNIMCGCYFNTMSVFLKKKIMHSVPQISRDMLGAVMDSILVDLSVQSDYAIVLETAFNLTEEECKGFLFLIPTTESLDMIFDALGID